MRPSHAHFRSPILRALALSALLGGCAHYVAVRHIVAPRNLPGSEIGNLSRLVLVMQLEPVEKPAGILGRAALDLLKEASDPAARISIPLPRDRAYRLLAACARTFTSPFSRIECYFIDGPFATGFIDSQRPSAVLILEFPRVAASQRSVEIQERGGGRRRAWRLLAEFSLGYRLLSWPDRRELASGRLNEQFEQSSPEEVLLEKWAGELDFGTSALAELRLDLLPLPVERYRILKKGKSEDMKRARKSVHKDDWEQAAGLWESEAGPDESAAYWNLGIYYERQGRWEEARENYARARGAARKRRDLAALLAYLEELNGVLPPGSAGDRPDGGWFDPPVAVLPFGNQSNDVNAPERARRLAWFGLREKGYQVQPLEEVSARLREQGITQGEQLKTLSLAEISRHLGGARLLTGTVEAFKTVNVGLYNLHTVSLNFVLYDSAGRPLMESSGHGFREILVNPKESGRSFLFGLAETAVTKAARSYLEEESRDAVSTGLEVLPARPAAP